MTAFVPGLQLSREMYADLVRPLLASRLPGLPSTFRDHPVGHEVHTVRGYVLEQLAVDLDVDLAGEIRARDWLTVPEQGLRTFYLMVAGWWT